MADKVSYGHGKLFVKGSPEHKAYLKSLEPALTKKQLKKKR